MLNNEIISTIWHFVIVLYNLQNSWDSLNQISLVLKKREGSKSHCRNPSLWGSVHESPARLNAVDLGIEALASHELDEDESRLSKYSIKF